MTCLISIIIFSLLLFIHTPNHNYYPLLNKPLVVRRNLTTNSFFTKIDNHNFYLVGEFKNLNYGDTISSQNYKCLPNNKFPSNATDFDFSKYLLGKKVFFICELYNYDKLTTINRFDFFLLNFRRKLISYFNSTHPTHQFISSLILGINNFSHDNDQLIKDLGISHLFVISGTHIAIIILLFQHLCGILNLNFYSYRFILTMGLIVCYFITGLNISTLRVIFIFLFQLYFNHKIDLFIIICALLLFNPYIIYDYSFILSYGLALFLQFSPIKSKNYLIHTLDLNFSLFCLTLPFQLLFNNQVNLSVIFINPIILGIFPILLISLLVYLIFPLDFILFFIDKLIFGLQALGISFDYWGIHLPQFNLFKWYLYLFNFYFLFQFRQKSIILLSLLLITTFIPISINKVNLYRLEKSYITIVNKSNKIIVYGAIDNFNQKKLSKFLKSLSIYQIDSLIITTKHNVNLSILNQNFSISQVTYQ